MGEEGEGRQDEILGRRRKGGRMRDKGEGVRDEEGEMKDKG